MRYDPSVAPDPRTWLEVDEAKRMAAVREYHERSPHTWTSSRSQVGRAEPRATRVDVASLPGRYVEGTASGDGSGRRPRWRWSSPRRPVRARPARYRCSARDRVSSGWKVQATTRPCRTRTGSPA